MRAGPGCLAGRATPARACTPPGLGALVEFHLTHRGWQQHALCALWARRDACHAGRGNAFSLISLRARALCRARPRHPRGAAHPPTRVAGSYGRSLAHWRAFSGLLETRSCMEGMSLFEDATSTWLRAKILPNYTRAGWAGHTKTRRHGSDRGGASGASQTVAKRGRANAGAQLSPGGIRPLTVVPMHAQSWHARLSPLRG